MGNPRGFMDDFTHPKMRTDLHTFQQRQDDGV